MANRYLSGVFLDDLYQELVQEEISPEELGATAAQGNVENVAALLEKLEGQNIDELADENLSQEARGFYSRALKAYRSQSNETSTTSAKRVGP